MKKIYLILLIVFIALLAFNLYAIRWDLGFDHKDNSINLIAAVASAIAIPLILVLDTWGRLGQRR